MPSLTLNKLLPLVVIIALSVIAAACGSDEPAGDCLVAEDGALVNAPCDVPAGVTAIPTDTPMSSTTGSVDPGFAAFRAAGCAACHAVEGTAASGMVGPDLTTVGTKGEAYVRQSIVNPSAVIADGFGDGIMPAGFGSSLNPEQLDTIVAWLMSR